MRPSRRPALFVVILAAALAAVAPSSGGEDTFAALEARFKQAVEEFMQAYRDASSDEERQELLDDPAREPRQAFTPAFVDASEKAGSTEEAVPFLIWLVRNGAIADPAVGEAAISTLFADHLESPQLDKLPGAIFALRDLRGLEVTLGDLERLAEAVGPATRAKTDLYRARALAAYGAVDGARELLETLVTAGDPEIADDAASRLADLSHPVLGEPAPALAGELARGGELGSGDLEGKVLLVDFWGTWCGPCIAKLPALREVHRRFVDDGLVVIGVNSDEDAERVRSFVADNDMTWPQLLDGSTSGPLADAWRVRSWPASFLVAADGTVLAPDPTSQQIAAALEASASLASDNP